MSSAARIDEIVDDQFGRLLKLQNFSTLAKCSLVCKAWAGAISDETWRAASKQEFRMHFAKIQPQRPSKQDVTAWQERVMAGEDHFLTHGVVHLMAGITDSRPLILFFALESIERCLQGVLQRQEGLPSLCQRHLVPLFHTKAFCMAIVRALGHSPATMVRKIACDVLHKILFCCPSTGPTFMDAGVVSALKRHFRLCTPEHWTLEMRVDSSFAHQQMEILTENPAVTTSDLVAYGPRLLEMCRDAIFRTCKSLACTAALCGCRARACSVNGGALTGLLLDGVAFEMHSDFPTSAKALNALIALGALLHPSSDLAVPNAPDVADCEEAAAALSSAGAVPAVMASLERLLDEGFEEVEAHFTPRALAPYLPLIKAMAPPLPRAEQGSEKQEERMRSFVEQEARLRSLTAVAAVSLLTNCTLLATSRPAALQHKRRLAALMWKVTERPSYWSKFPSEDLSTVRAMLDQDTFRWLSYGAFDVGRKYLAKRLTHMAVRDEEMALVALKQLGALGEAQLAAEAKREVDGKVRSAVERMKECGNRKMQYGSAEEAELYYLWAIRLASGEEGGGQEQGRRGEEEESERGRGAGENGRGEEEEERGGEREEGVVCVEMVTALHNNRAQALLNLRRWTQAEAAAQRALQLDPCNAKAQHRCQKAQFYLSHPQQPTGVRGHTERVKALAEEELGQLR